MVDDDADRRRFGLRGVRSSDQRGRHIEGGGERGEQRRARRSESKERNKVPRGDQGKSQSSGDVVFSWDACGVCGISNVNIEHAGRTDPVGTIVLEMQGHSTKVRSASGMLLRVIG